MTRITAISIPICPTIWPCQAFSALRMTLSAAAAGTVPSSTLEPPTTTVTKASTMKGTPIVGIRVMVGA